jgi:hypothetical protein
LPAHQPTRVWGGNGDGKLCSLCRLIVGREDLEYELDVDEVIYRFHSMCHAAWQFECARAEHIAHTIPVDGENKKDG